MNFPEAKKVNQGIGMHSGSCKGAFKWMIALLGLTILIYSSALTGEFVWDDRIYFIDNDILPDLKPWDIKEIFIAPSNYWMESLPVRDFLYVVQYSLSGPVPYTYHIVSLLLYLVTAMIVFMGIASFYNDFVEQRVQLFSSISNSNLSALIVTSLFLLHPVHVEAVAYISSQKDILYSLFSFITVIFFYRLCKKRHLSRWKEFVLALLFYYASFLSKSTAVSTALFFPLLWLLFLRKKGDSYIRALGIWIIINLPVLFWILHVIGISEAHGVSSSGLPLIDLVLRGVRILGAHTILVFKPFPLNFGYPFVPEWSLDINFITGMVLLLALFLALIFKPRSIATLGLLFYCIYIFPMLQIVMEVSNAVIFDRYLFAPLLGMCILFERGLFFALSRWKRFQNAFIAIFLVVLTALSLQTISYIPKFSSDVASLEHAYYTFPGWKRAAFDYVDALVEAKEFKEARRITETEKTFSRPLWVRDYFRGWILLENGQVDNAIKHLHRASYYTHAGGYFPFADIKLGKAYILKKDYNRARTFFNNVINAKIYNPLDYYRAKKMLEEIKEN